MESTVYGIRQMEPSEGSLLPLAVTLNALEKKIDKDGQGKFNQNFGPA